jgi:hypothetical protein
MQATIVVNINVQCLIVGWCIDESDLSSLHKVVGDNNVLLVWRDLDVVGPDGWLDSVRVIQALDVVEVRDVESSDVICGCEGEIGVFAVLGNIRARKG